MSLKNTAFCFLIAFFSIPLVSHAKVIPSQMSVEGYYHRDHLGVGRFSFLLVSPDLHKQLAPYEGKRIRLFAKKIFQYGSPGPAMIQEIGKIEQLEQLGLKVTLTTRPEKILPGQPFELLITFANTRKGKHPPLHIECNNGVIWTEQTKKQLQKYAQGPKGEHLIFPSYKLAQLARARTVVDRIPYRYWNLSSPGTNRLSLASGERQVVIMKVPAGRITRSGELHLAGSVGSIQNPISFSTWLPITIQEKKKTPAVPENSQRDVPVVVDQYSISSPNSGSYRESARLTQVVTFRLTPKPSRHVLLMADQFERDAYAPPRSRLEALDKEGRPILLTVHSAWSNKSVKALVKLPVAGALWTMKFRKINRNKSHRIPDKPIAKLLCHIWTPRGIETISLLVPKQRHVWERDTETPFGPELKGLKLRLKPVPSSFRPDQRLMFHTEILYGASKSVQWGQVGYGGGSLGSIYLDGNPVTIPREINGYGIRLDGTEGPRVWRDRLYLPPSATPKPGAHTLRFEIASSRQYHEAIPDRLVGTMKSNTAVFTVEYPKKLTEKQARRLAADLTNKTFAAKTLVNPVDKKPINPFVFEPKHFRIAKLTKGRWDIRFDPPAGLYAIVSFSRTGGAPKVDVGFSPE